MSGGGGSSSPSSTNQTVTQVQQLPAFEQQFSQENQDLSRSLGSQPYPNYQGQLIAPMNGVQDAGIQQAEANAYSYVPALGYSDMATHAGLDATQSNNYIGAGGAQVGNALNGSAAQGFNQAGQAFNGVNPLSLSAGNAGQVQQFMNPYIQASLQPQLLQAQTQLGQEQNQINSQATGAGAFGDARQGAESALQNYYGNQNMAGIEATGLNTGYNNAVSALQNQQQTMLGEQGQQLGEQNAQLGEQGVQLQGAQQYGNLANLAQQEQNLQFQGGQQYANIAQLQSQLGTQAANQVYDAGSLQQQQQQEELNAAYQQFQNQSQWPYQMLNVRESALSNSPYGIANSTTLPGPNGMASGLGAFGSLAGMLGSLTTSPRASGPFGGG